MHLVDLRSDIAWKNANYAQIWEYLRDEYELTQRFGSLDFKLKFVEVHWISFLFMIHNFHKHPIHVVAHNFYASLLQHNIRFLQEILQNRKSDFLEWLIIILISVEILISVFNIARESPISSMWKRSWTSEATKEIQTNAWITSCHGFCSDYRWAFEFTASQ